MLPTTIKDNAKLFASLTRQLQFKLSKETILGKNTTFNNFDTDQIATPHKQKLKNLNVQRSWGGGRNVWE